MKKGIFLKVVKKRKTAAAAIALLICLAMVAVLYSIGPEPGSPNESIVVKVVDTIRDELNPFRTRSPKNEFIEEYDLELSVADFEYFKEASETRLKTGYKTDETMNYRKIKLVHDGMEYDVEMALFGDQLEHSRYPKKSFKIKAGENMYIEGKRRLNFVLPMERTFFNPLFAEYLAGKIGLFSNEHEIALVKFNGMPQGLYIVEESWGKDLVERNRQPGLVLLKRSENWWKDHSDLETVYDFSTGVTFGLVHMTPFDQQISNLQYTRSGNDREIKYMAGKLFEAAEANDQSQFESLFDIEKLAESEAWRAILGTYHNASGDNLRLFYDTTKGKFWIAPRSEGGIGSLKNSQGGIESALSTQQGQPIPLLRYVQSNAKLRNMRNQKIYEVIKDKEEVLNYYDQLEQKYREAFLNDNTSIWRSSKIAYFMDKSKTNLYENISLLEKQFDYSKAYINIIEKGNAITVEILPDSTTEIKANNFAIKLNPGKNTTALVQDMQQGTKQTIPITQNAIELSQIANQNILQADLGNEMQPILTTFKYQITFQDSVDINGVEIEMENAITGKVLPKDSLYVAIAKGNNNYFELQNQPKEEFLETHPELSFKEKGNKLHLVEGTYEIKENAIIPKNLEIAIDAGTKIKIAPGKSIVSYSELDIQGTEEKPVEITRLDQNQAFGVLGVIGEGTGKTTIKHLQIEGGSETFINGTYLSGQLSIYHSDLEITNSKISNSSSDDGLNAKYSKILIENTEFTNNKTDQADLDYCNGTINKSTFSTNKNNEGDGLDISGSSILIKESSFEGMEDKGISIGEKSWVLLYDNTIANNNMGSAVKDLSKAFFIKNALQNNKIAIAAYQKKQVFGGANFYIYENVLQGNQDKFSLDEKSDYRNISFSEEGLQALNKGVETENIASLKQLLEAKE